MTDFITRSLLVEETVIDTALCRQTDREKDNAGRSFCPLTSSLRNQLIPPPNNQNARDIPWLTLDQSTRRPRP
jgi:hypothetical protein